MVWPAVRRELRWLWPLVLVAALLTMNVALHHDDYTRRVPDAYVAPSIVDGRVQTPSTSPNLIPPLVITTSTTQPVPVRVAEPASSNLWDRLADCESGEWDANRVPIPGSRNWADRTASYEGGLHFVPSTWDGYRLPEHPARAFMATREQQITVGLRVLAGQGWAAWPVCSWKVGAR
jgi:hypothetical protein